MENWKSYLWSLGNITVCLQSLLFVCLGTYIYWWWYWPIQSPGLSQTDIWNIYITIKNGTFALASLIIGINFPGRRFDGNWGLADCLYRVRVCCPGGVHGHSAQDEDEEADGDQAEEGQLRHHGPRILCHLPHPLHHLQCPLLVIYSVEQASTW